jgi:predicted MPP superfamily phosphohydrolase
MRGSIVFAIILFAIIFLIDQYSFRGIKILTGDLPVFWRLSIHIAFWMVPLVILIITIIISFRMREVMTTGKFRIWYFLMGMFMLFYIPKIVFVIFQLGNDIVRLTGWIMTRFSSPESQTAATGSVMSRTEFLSKIGIVISAIPFLSVAHGIIIGRFNYQVKNIKLNFKNLPTAFDGFKILQISDWHIGSFHGHTERVEEAIELINRQNADLILFTGDIVNNVAEEMQIFIPLLKKINAEYGVYSILGNHDYGEYVSWDSEEDHTANMHRLYDFEKQAGFVLLRNDSVILKKGKDKIGIAGVENWGLPPFPQYGDLNKALGKIQSLPFKILMSHDPSHWDAEVLNKTDIDLTLSGHTHGMQFGINIPGIKWSPIKWKYPRWSGLYMEKFQYLYVNVGIGYIGFPGRVGFMPEITVFNLQCDVD